MYLCTNVWQVSLLATSEFDVFCEDEHQVIDNWYQLIKLSLRGFDFASLSFHAHVSQNVTDQRCALLE